MAPDEIKLRLRKQQLSVVDDDDDVMATEQLVTMKDLNGNEVCIDGVIYDISNFDHPGGETIKVFGGNDVTVQYRMIHPRHTSKHLEKMKRVGTVADYETEYEFGTPFELEIKREVFKIVRRGREFATLGFILRAMFYITLFYALQYLWVMHGSSYTLAVVYGMSMALIGLNVQHDANHGAISRKSWINDSLGLFADFIGNSKWLWIEQHWTHHAYTNHIEKDPDNFGGEPFMIFANYPKGHSARKWYHRFQTLFVLPLFTGYYLSTILSSEVGYLQHSGAQQHAGMVFKNNFVVSRRKFAILLRLVHLYIHVVTPFQHYGLTSWTAALGHVLVMTIAGSLTLAVPFSVSHNFENSNRDPTAHYRKTGERVCWFKSQVETSCTYGGFVAGCLTGGLNFQIEHHLFPRMSSAWYPYIAPTVREVCKKHGVTYVYYPSLLENLISTFKYFHAVGRGPQ